MGGNGGRWLRASFNQKLKKNDFLLNLMLARLRSASIALNTRKIVKHSTLILKSFEFKLKTSRVFLKKVIFLSCPLILKISVDPRDMICSVLGLETKKSKDNVEEMC